MSSACSFALPIGVVNKAKNSQTQSFAQNGGGVGDGSKSDQRRQEKDKSGVSGTGAQATNGDKKNQSQKLPTPLSCTKRRGCRGRERKRPTATREDGTPQKVKKGNRTPVSAVKGQRPNR